MGYLSAQQVGQLRAWTGRVLKERNGSTVAGGAWAAQALITPHDLLAGGSQTPFAQLQAWLSGVMRQPTVQNSTDVQQVLNLLPGARGAVQDPAELLHAFSPRMLEHLNASRDGSVSTDQRGHRTLDLGWGLVLKRFEAGDNSTFPEVGSEVSVDFDAFFENGTEYDSTRARGPLGFKLGEAGNIPGLEIAMKHMSLGERSLIRVPQPLLYPTMPAGPCPPVALIVFDASLRRVGASTAPLAGGGAR